MQNTSSGGVSTGKNSVENSETPKFQLTLIDLKSFTLGDHEYTARSATHQQFTEFGRSLVQLDVPDDERWTVEERRDFLNWCIEYQVLDVQEGRLASKKQESEEPSA